MKTSKSLKPMSRATPADESPLVDESHVAEDLAARVGIDFTQPRPNRHLARVRTFPGIFAHGDTPRAAEEQCRQNARFGFEVLLERGQSVEELLAATDLTSPL